MVERQQVRCSGCRAVFPLAVLWALGDACPQCSSALTVAGRLPHPREQIDRGLRPLCDRAPADLRAAER